jgi:hypothetical protein
MCCLILKRNKGKLKETSRGYNCRHTKVTD